MDTTIRILAISGSLRAASSNTALLRIAAALAPDDVEVVLYEGLDELPHFSPERDGETPPAPVRHLRASIEGADAVLFCTPEYAHGMPGSLKNALDWLVSSGDFDGGKPTGVISASPSFLGGDKAHASLVHTLIVLGANIPAAAKLIIPLVRTKMTADGQLSDPETTQALRAVLDALVQAVATD